MKTDAGLAFQFRVFAARRVAEYVAVPQQILFRVPQELSYERAAMMEPLTIAAHALARTRLALYDTAVVVGSGMIGLLVIQLLKLAGAGHIVAVDISDDRLALAGAVFGATHLLRSDRDDVPAAVRSLNTGRRTDVVFEAVGTGSTVSLAIACAGARAARATLIRQPCPARGGPFRQEIVLGDYVARHDKRIH